jgi:hypothetical protein
MDGASFFLFAKIEAERKQLAQRQVYSIVSGPNEYLILYRAEGVIAPSFMALAETSNLNGLVGRITPMRTSWKDYAMHAPWTKT